MGGGGFLDYKKKMCTAETTEEIKATIVNFYTNLYSEKPIQNDTMTEVLNQKTVEERYFKLEQQGMDFNEEIKQIKTEMSVLAEIKSKGVILRSKEKEIEEGEKCTRYFLKKIVGSQEDQGAGDPRFHPGGQCGHCG